MDNKGSFIGIFVFIIFTLIIVVVSGIFIYIGDTTETRLKQTLGNRQFGNNPDTNGTIDETFGGVNVAYANLYWIAVFIIVAQVFGIIIGSYMVTTRPVFIIPFIFLMIVAVIVGVGVSNAYELLIAKPTMSSTFAEFDEANLFLLNLPYIVTIIGFVGAIIMFSQLGRRRSQFAVG